jgi:probable O-glycosylation ligase (exosortase A-associated)
MSSLATVHDWWRPVPRGRTAAGAGSRVAFGALVAFTIILLLSPQAWVPVLKTFRIAFLAAGLAMLAHLLDRAVGRRSLDPLHPEMAIAAALVAWAVFTIPLSLWPGGSVEELTEHFLKAVVFGWLIGALVTTRLRLRQYTWVLVLCAVPLAVTGLVNYRSGVFLATPTSAVQRIAGYTDDGSGLAANPNDLALMLNLLIPLAAMLAATARGVLLKLTAVAVLLLSVATVVVTFSRAGFLALGATGLLLIVAIARRQPFVAFAAALAIAVIVPPLLPEGYLSRLGTITDVSSDPTGSAQGRLGDWTASVEIVAQHPITGVGLGQNILALNQIRGSTWRAVHNVYLQYAVDLGLPGLFVFLWLFAAVFRTARRVRRRAAADPALREVSLMAEGVQISLVAFAVSAFFHPIAYQFYFFCIAGLALAVKAVLGSEQPRVA